jgi:hypothetical protein
MDVGALAILRTSAPTDRKSWTMVIHLDPMMEPFGTSGLKEGGVAELGE